MVSSRARSGISAFNHSRGNWRDPQLQYQPNAELKVIVTNFTNVNGVMVVAFDSERLELERKIRMELN